MMSTLTRVAPERTVTPTVLSVPYFGDMMESDIMRRLTTEQFIEKARAVHGDCYDYSLVEYRTTREKVRISCSAHGVFEQTPGSHLSGDGCPKCRYEHVSLSLRQDLAGERYGQLSVIAFDREKKKWRCQCECGNEHYATANLLRTGKVKSCGCLKKGIWQRHSHPQSGRASGHRASIVGKTFGRLTALRYAGTKANRAYWEAECTCGSVTIVSTDSLVTGNTKSCGCLHQDAAVRRGAAMQGMVREDSRQKSMSRVGETFGKLTVLRVYWRDFDAGYRVAIAECECECGGKLEVRLPDLVNGKTVSCGCGRETSQGEIDLANFIATIADVKTQFCVSGWTYDVAVPAKNLLIEFNGLYWHSHPRKRRGAHYAKRRDAEANGYRLITIWEDDWKRKRERMESLLRRAIEGPVTKIGARETVLVKVPRGVAKEFHEDHHVQDFWIPMADQHYGLFDQADLVAVASFDKKGVLHRYTVLDGLSIVGGLQKCVKAFRGDFGDLPIVTYCDRDHFMGNLYRAAGFVKTGGTMTMSYVVGSARQRREGYMKHKLPSLFGEVDMDQREIDICAEHGVYACWNSGTEKYVLA